MNLTGNWNYPTSVRFGVGRIAELAEVCRSPVSYTHLTLPTKA